MPLELATRSLALYNLDNGISCTEYMVRAQVSALNATAICSSYNFTNIESLKLFVNATWYSNLTDVKTATNMNDTELATFYNPLFNGSFQYNLNE